MGELFEETVINGMRLRNRFIRSATWEGLAGEDGSVTQRLMDKMSELARGGVGLIITGHAYVEKQGQASPWQLGVYDDRLIPGLCNMVDAVHEHGGKIAIQLAHAGYYARRELTGTDPLAPSLPNKEGRSPKKEITHDDIERIVNAFGDAGRRAKESGFDAVQIHSAHGYLLSQFLSPAYNRREDEYGGSIQNRARILLQIYEAVRKAVGANYPVLIKINCSDFIDGGLSLEDSIEAGKLLERAGIDAIELSGGVLTGGKLSPIRFGINTEDKEAYFREEAKAFKEAISVPLILVGGIRSYQVSDRLLKDGISDYFSMCRPLIREPGLVKRWEEGDLSRAKCISDNQCFAPAMQGDGIYCVTEEKQGER